MSAVAELELNDTRVEFIADYVLKTLRVKGDKFTKMYGLEENKQLFMDFFEKPEILTFIVSANAGGGLSVSTQWPEKLKTKACYFVKKGREAVTKDTPMRTALIYGDLSYSPVDQLAAFVDEVLVPLLSNDHNHDQWPHVVSQDVLRHVHNLKSSVFVVSGQVQGKTLLPLPVGAEKVEENAAQVDDKLDGYDRALVHAIESVIIEWTHQIRDVLKKDSSQFVLNGQFPNPTVELQFWKAKAQNLECIYDQLRDPKVRKMAELLEKTNSSYFPSFKNLFRDVVSSLTEAQDINLHLMPLRYQLEDFEQTEFDESEKMFAPLMHTVCLVWAHSSYYNTPGRIVVLLQEMCNMLIDMARNFLEPTEIFKNEVEEAIEKVRTSLKVVRAFRQCYEDHRVKIKDYFPEGKEPKEWEFAPQLVFHRFDKFVERVEIVMELFETSMEFLKLEKIEFGGIKGKVLSAQTVQIFEEFNELYKVFSEFSGDPLDPLETDFLPEYEKFKASIADLDRRLASIVCQGFDDCSGLEAGFKLIDVFGSLLERPLIKQDFQPNYPKVVEMMDQELTTAKAIYDEHMRIRKETGKMPLHKNMAKISGSLKWAAELRGRITTSMTSFKHIEHPCMESPEAKDVFDHYEKMLELLGGFEREVYEEWVAGVDEACSFNLAQPLINRSEETKLISVNFDPQLVAVLREVKYLEIRGSEEIPESAAAIYSKNDTFRQYVANLDLTVQWYNKVRTTVLEVEYPLVEGQLEQIDVQLQRAEKDLNWNSEAVWEYIEETREMVRDLEVRVQKTKNNVEEIQKVMSTWSKAPLFVRKEGKNETLLQLDDREDRLKKRYGEVEQAGEKIQNLLKENLAFFKGDGDSDNWKAYVDYVDEMVVDGFFNTIHCSLKFLLENTELKGEVDPLFEALLELQAPDRKSVV